MLECKRVGLAELEQRRPGPLSAGERKALTRNACELPWLRRAPTDTARERKEPLCTLTTESWSPCNAHPRHGSVEIHLGKRARSRLTVPLTPGGRETGRTRESTIELIAVSPATFPTARSPRASTARRQPINERGRHRDRADVHQGERRRGARTRRDPRSSGTPSGRRAPRRRGSTRARSPRPVCSLASRPPLTPWRIWLTDEVSRPFVPTSSRDTCRSTRPPSSSG